MDNATYGDLMAEYQKHRHGAKHFAHWEDLDSFVEKLVSKLSPKKPEPMQKWAQYAYDDMGTALPHEELLITFDPADGKRIE